MANKLIFIGDSFTFGDDSGGDHKRIEEFTYPFYFSKLANLEYENLAYSGYSNEAALFKLQEYIYTHKDPDTTVLFGLTSIYRSVINCKFTNPNEKQTINGLFENNIIFDTVNGIFDIDHKLEKYHLAKQLIVSDEDKFLFLKNLNIMYAAKGICDLYGYKIIFIDVYLKLKKIITDNKLIVNDPLINNIIISDNNNSFYEYIKDIHGRTLYSSTGHFYANGYEKLALYIFNKTYGKL